MYSAAVPATTSMNGIGSGMVDGTINPAALNTPGSVLPASSSVNAQSSPRGQKRSRSPEQSGDPYGAGAEDDDQKPSKKRGRPIKGQSPSSVPSQQTNQDDPAQQQTPQLPSQSLPQDPSSTPAQTSPPKATGSKPVIKALPTVRDHTTDQLTIDQDEYIPREFDEAGERKVSSTGEPLGGRQFKMRTFYVAHRGDKRFMLATECARVLGYRDSYLLFNKNRSLHKIIATQQEKDELIHQEILPYSYRSRQIAIVTAKSMFRQFGARVIEGGRRVRDDYWETKALKQGFTEEDMAGDKRPGATKARDQAAAQEASQAPLIPTGYGHHQDIFHANAPDHPQPVAGLPLMRTPEDSRMQAYNHIARPRQEMTGVPYQDRTQPTPAADVMHQATNAADLNRQHTQHRNAREKLINDHWHREPEMPVSTPQSKSEHSPIISQSPHLSTSSTMMDSQQPMMQHQSSQMMSSPQSTYSSHHQQTPHHQNPHAQSPARSSMPSTIRPELSHQQQRPSVSYPPGQSNPQGPPYSYSNPNHQLWGHPPPQPPPHQSPMSSHHAGLPQYSPSAHPQQPSIQQHQAQSPHPQQQQSPRQSFHHSQSNPSLNYQNIAGLPGGPASSYSNPTAMANVRAMYPPHSASPSHQQFMQQQQQATSAGQQGGMQGWAPPPLQQQQQPQGGQQQPVQSPWQGYPTSSGY